MDSKPSLAELLRNGMGSTPTVLNDRSRSSHDNLFIQCDKCNVWYHYPCVGIAPGDLRIRDKFICDYCDQEIKLRKREQTHPECGLPGCDKPLRNPSLYFATSILGLKMSRNPRDTRWLVKWYGYPIKDATWEPKRNIKGDADTYIQEFMMKAKEEGLQTNIKYKTIVLEEAAQYHGRSRTRKPLEMLSNLRS